MDGLQKMCDVCYYAASEPVYTIQPVVKQFDNRLNVCKHDTVE